MRVLTSSILLLLPIAAEAASVYSSVSPGVIYEGQTATISGSLSAVNPSNVWWSMSSGGGQWVAGSGSSQAFQFLDDGSYNYSVAASGTEYVPYQYWVSTGYDHWHSTGWGNGYYHWHDSGYYATGYSPSNFYTSTGGTLQVLNVAPIITELTAPGSLILGAAALLAVSVYDPGLLDIQTYSWDWDNDGVYDLTTTSGTAQFTATAAGIYDIGLRVSDGDGGYAFTTTQLEVSAVPEAANTCFLLALGLGGAELFRRRQQARQAVTTK